MRFWLVRFFSGPVMRTNRGLAVDSLSRRLMIFSYLSRQKLRNKVFDREPHRVIADLIIKKLGALDAKVVMI